MSVSIIIPARNEIYLQKTIESVCAAAKSDYEIIAVCDGYWPNPPIKDHPKVHIIHHTEPVGQRAATNEGVRLARKKYILKIDGHTILDEGFDIKLAQDCQPDWTVVPLMYGLDAEKWEKKNKRPASFMCVTYDSEKILRTEYWFSFEKRPEGKKDIADLMSCMGNFIFMERERYWQLGGLDENHGSWGQVGVEVALKSWLSGGRMVLNKKTWFAHLWRKQCPYSLHRSDVDKARTYSTDLWMNDRWLLAKRPLSWLVEKFAPVPTWNGTFTKPKANTTIIYYTDNSLDEKFADRVRQLLVKSAEGKPIISISQKPIDLGRNICIGDIGRSHLSIYKQLLAGGECADTDYIALAEHDCLYTPEHFGWIPPQKDVFFYNINQWFAQWNKRNKGEYSYFRRKALSQLICGREIFIKAVREKIWMLENGFMIKRGKNCACELGVLTNDEAFMRPILCEPGVCDDRKEYIDTLAQFKDLGKEIGRWKTQSFKTILPNLDIRHGKNFTGKKHGRNLCYELAPWGKLETILGL